MVHQAQSVTGTHFFHRESSSGFNYYGIAGTNVTIHATVACGRVSLLPTAARGFLPALPGCCRLTLPPHIETQPTVRRDSMIRRLFAMLALSIISLASGMGQAQTRTGLVNLDIAERYGLERAWFTQARVNPARDKIGGMFLHVSSTRAQNIFEVITPTGQKTVFSDRSLDVFGDPLGVEGAQKKAEDKKRLLELQGIESRVEQRVVPDITLFISTNSGIIHAIDAETGATRWVATAGKRDYPASTPAVSDQYVAVANGSTLYLLNAEDGTQIWQRKVRGIPSGSAAIVNGQVLVTTLSGIVESYQLDAPEELPLLYYSRGAIEFSPTITRNSVAWATDRGDVNLVTPGQRHIRYRFMTNDPVAGPVAFLPPEQLFVTTRSGFLYSFDETYGDILWQYSTGEQVEQPPLVINGVAYVATKYTGMHAIDAIDGSLKWWTPGVQQMVGITKSHMYATTSDKYFVIADLSNGTHLARIPAYENDFVFTNTVTDRIYIGTLNGLIQCLHERGADWPTIHSPEPSPESPPSKEGEGDKPADPKEAPVDPFSGDKVDAKDAENPFK
jgi:outer membrane protein assembly factor BamB